MGARPSDDLPQRRHEIREMKIKCPACAQVLNVPDAAAGKVIKCPCGKQLRAPSPKPGGAAPAAAGGRPAQPGGAGQAAARPAANQPLGGFDAEMFDELTDQDLKPVSRPGQKSAPAVGANTAKLLQQHAATAGGVSRAQFRKGPVASPWIRLGAAIIDGFIIAFIAAPVVAACMFFLVPMMVDGGVVQNAEEATAEEATVEEQTALASALMVAYIVSVGIAYIPPIIIYAIMVTKSGQTPGKKLCGIRILRSQTGELPGFVRGVLLRSWIFNIAYSIPVLGGIFAIVDYAMIFGSERKCLHDVVAGTMVVES
jgi:uncharacterized RDD family membrane protein YckC